MSARVDNLFRAAFAGPRDPRSAPYKAGVRAALAYRIDGTGFPHPYQPGTAEDDAYYAGISEGHAIWRTSQERRAS